MSNVLVTGAAGFIGFHLCKRLLIEGNQVFGIDNISGYYDISLKLDRLKELGVDRHEVSEGQISKSSIYDNFHFLKTDIKEKFQLEKLFDAEGIEIVVNLAAQAGVRYSVENPQVYIDANIQGFINILELCRKYPVKHLVYASSSSVYGGNKNMPFSVKDNVDHPISLYAATKKSNELMAHAYAHLFNIPCSGLRFFTVYGPWGRPDMALFLFANALINDEPIKIFNNGNLSRDFTYVDDIIEGVIRVMCNAPTKTDSAPYKIYNIGNNNPVKLMDFVSTLEKEVGKKAKKEFLPMQPGDVEETFADVSELMEDFNYAPKTSLSEGVTKFVEWHSKYYNYNFNKVR